MNLLARFDPGDAVAGLAFIVVWQTSVVIALAAFLSRILFRWRAGARHVLWLGTLVLVSISPAVAVVASRSSLSLWAVTLPVATERPVPADEAWGPARQVSRAESSSLLKGSVETEIEPPRQTEAVTTMELARVTAARREPPALAQRGSAVRGGMFLLWAVGALAGLARTAVGWWRLAAHARSASALDRVRHGATLERVRAGLGVASLPPVVASPDVRAPVAVGLLSSRVILPEGLAESLANDALHDVLVHECAHVVRLDAWVGLLQRLVGVLFWPHPLVHFASGQLTRAREEVCDNHVLQCGDARGYARTLLALTEQCLPFGASRPGLGLLGARWTLADRVAGLLDARRNSMTRTTFRLKFVVCFVLLVTGLAAASVRLDRPASAEGSQSRPADRQGASPAVWKVEGTVVDERGQAVEGAVVRAVTDGPAVDEIKTRPDGAFVLTLGGRQHYIRGVVAETDGGARLGLVRFDPARELGAMDPVRVVVKPSRPVRVRVEDAAHLPAPGATVEAIDLSYQTHATTGSDGTATLRVPADAKVRWVIGLKAGLGFDYFENYRTTPAADYPPLAADVILSLDGADTAIVKAVDSNDQAVPGVEIVLTTLSKPLKVSYANVGRSTTARATTDGQGLATFDWLPKGTSGVFRFEVAAGERYSSRDLAYYQQGGQSKLTVHLLRETRLSGTVRLPNGRPAEGVLIKAEGGPRSGSRIHLAARTLADGSYVLEAPAESSYMMTVVDETWAAPSLSNVIVREGRAHAGLDFALVKGTLLHGQVSEAPSHRPAAGAVVWLTEEGGPRPKDLPRGGFHASELMQISTADASGHYHFRVGPGRYSLRSPHAGGTESTTVEVKDEDEIVRDLALKGAVRATYFTGVVLEKTPTGDRAVAGAQVRSLRAGILNTTGPSTADPEGRFRMLRIPGEQTLYAVSPDRSLAGLMRLPAEPDNVRFVISKSPELTGRVVDSDGKPQAQRTVLFRIDSGPIVERSGRQTFGTHTDDQGRFRAAGAPVGSHVEVTVSYPRRPNSATPRTVVRFEVSDTGPVVISDLIIPAEKPTN
jgi:beta-lactamase regulating signal transducer with metallopeptidase domain